MNNDMYLAWIKQIYERDTFYLYVLAIVATGALWYYTLRLWRFFKFVLVAILVIAGAGIVWGLTQL